jgi:drug/metabolite transporter (DMT)-like permease
MNWGVISLLGALGVSTQDAWVKKCFSHLSPYEMSAYPLFYSLPFFLAAFPFIQGPPPGSGFWSALIVCLPLESAAFVLYMHAIKVSPLSLTVPHLAFTPAFILATGYAFLGETSSLAGFLGVLTTIAGSYVLNSTSRDEAFSAPFRAILSDSGSRTMLLVAALYSITSVMAKRAILRASPVYFGVSFSIVFNSLLLAVFFLTGRVSLKSLRRSIPQGIVLGMLFFFQIVVNNIAMSLAKVTYVIAVKRLSILFSVLYGEVLFHEGRLLRRLSGAIVMVAGAVMISIWGR